MSVLIMRYKNQKEKECIKISGVDFGSYLEIVEENRKFILCKRSGYLGWIGIGMQHYYPPKFLLFEKEMVQDTVKDCLGRSFKYNRKTKKQVMKKAMKALKEGE